jgi:hypothetical protein
MGRRVQLRRDERTARGVLQLEHAAKTTRPRCWAIEEKSWIDKHVCKKN